MDSAPTDRLTTCLSGQAPEIPAAERWFDDALAGRPIPSLVVTIGLGHGEILDVLDRRAPSTRVLAFEPDGDAARHLLTGAHVRRRIDDGRLTLLIDPDYAGADKAWRVFPADPTDHVLLVQPALVRDGGSAALRAARTFKQILFGATANAEARRRFAPGYLAGTLHNLPEVAAGRDMRTLVDAYRGMPAVVVAAGPSLDEAIGELTRLAGRAVVFAADTALRPLVTHGLAPEFVVAVDPQPTNARHFHTLPPLERTWLVSEASIHPSVILPFGDRTFWFRVSDHEPWPWYNELGVDVGHLDVWGSVLTAAFQLALVAGCDPIVITGADLAFTGGRPYGRGTTYEFDWAYVVSGGGSIDDAWRPFLKPDDQVTVPDIHGHETQSTGFLLSFRDWMLTRAKQSGRRVVNASGAGILFGDGIEQGTLGGVLSHPRAIARPETIAPRTPTSTSRHDLARQVREAARHLRRGTVPHALRARWTRFCGGAMDAPTVCAAMDRAAGVLERATPDGRRETPAIPWSALRVTGGARSICDRLPEATTRMAAVLRGDPALPGALPARHSSRIERLDLLADAFTVLRSIAAWSNDADLATPVPPNWPGQRPLGAWPDWPVEIARAVRLFEACLGDACHTSVPPAASQATFFSRPVVLRYRREKPRAPHPRRASDAVAVLAMEWLLAADQASSGSDDRTARPTDWWRALVTAIVRPLDPSPQTRTVALVLHLDGAPSIRVPVAVDDRALARVLTGAIADGDEPIELASLVHDGRSASLSLDMRAGRRAFASPAPRRSTATLLVPRSLARAGLQQAVFACTTPRGAVCVGLHEHTSLLVGENGRIEPYLSWPRPTNGELPFGVDGAVAWGVGRATWPDGGPGYVMYRPTRTAAPTIVELPFGPSTGVCHEGRMYWTCFPFGVGTWAPGEAPASCASNLTLFGVEPTSDGFVLHPRVRGLSGATERRLPAHGWSWTPGAAAEPRALGPLGPASSQATAFGWTAVAYPQADLVRLTSSLGRTLSMTCYYPFAVAWAGRSLVVCTNDGDPLLFERLVDVLDRGGRE